MKAKSPEFLINSRVMGAVDSLVNAIKTSLFLDLPYFLNQARRELR